MTLARSSAGSGHRFVVVDVVVVLVKLVAAEAVVVVEVIVSGV